MALELNGTTGVSLVQDGVVTAADLAAGAVGATQLASTLDLTGKTVTLPSGTGGKVLQVVQAYKTDTFSTSATGDTDITGLSVSITPSSASNKILVTSNVSGFSNNGVGGGLCLQRNGTKIGLANASGSRTRSSFSGDLYTGDASGTIQMFFNAVACYLDSPNTTSAVTYKVTIQNSGNIVKINYEESDSDSNDTNRGVSHITVMEIAA